VKTLDEEIADGFCHGRTSHRMSIGRKEGTNNYLGNSPRRRQFQVSALQMR
jgi:hypothetical protein